MARYLGQAGDFERTRPLLLQLARLVTRLPGETALLAQLALELKRPDVGLTIARRAPQNGVTLFDAAFPVVDLGATGSIERALALALTRQESSFNAAAVSSSGCARLDAAPARNSARCGRPAQRALHPGQARHAIPPTTSSSAAGYLPPRCRNALAGPTKSLRRLQCWSQPRRSLVGSPWAIRATSKIDMIDWIETIPTARRATTSQRIMEGVVVYRDRLNGQVRTVPPALGRS